MGEFVWHREHSARMAGHRPLDAAKVQAPGIARTPDGGFRLFYTAIGPGKPFATCQGYILSAVSRDGLDFVAEPGIRIAPDPSLPHLALRALAPSVLELPDGRWRMYFEARGAADVPSVICSAVSDDQLDWHLEPGIRLAAPGPVGAPRVARLADGRVRLLVFRRDAGGTVVVATHSPEGLDFGAPQVLLRDRTGPLDMAGVTAAELIDEAPGEVGLLLYSAWQDRPGGLPPPPLHPSLDPDAVASGSSADFAAASIAADMSGYRSRILMRHVTPDGVLGDASIAIEGDGYGREGLDAVHAEDMVTIRLDDGRRRLYYAACDASGAWRIASAISG